MVDIVGADPTGTNDSSAAIQASLDANDYVTAPSGVYRCDSMIELSGGKTLHLLGGASFIRKSAYSAATDPVVWMKGAGCSLIGSGQRASAIQTENRCPTGVVALGHRDMTQSHGNVTYCTLQNLRLSGPVNNGQTTGEPDVCLYMANPQLNGLVSYFHNVSGLLVERANIGIWLNGLANANTINNIQGVALGNVTLGPDKNVFVYCHGALDNAVSNVFFHNSPNSIGLLVDDYDSRSPYANSFRGMVFEQGGASALGLKALSGAGSFYEIRHNVAGGNWLYSGFESSNWLFGLGKSLSLGTLKVTGASTLAKTLVGGAVDDGVSAQKIEGNQAISNTSQRSYRATGPITITVRFGYTLNGSVLRSGLVELMFDGILPNGVSRQTARYYIPVKGVSAWFIETPVAIYGTGLTITQVESTASSVKFTVAGTAGASGINSIFATATSNVQARLE